MDLSLRYWRIPLPAIAVNKFRHFNCSAFRPKHWPKSFRCLHEIPHASKLTASLLPMLETDYRPRQLGRKNNNVPPNPRQGDRSLSTPSGCFIVTSSGTIAVSRLIIQGYKGEAVEHSGFFKREGEAAPGPFISTPQLRLVC